MTDQKQLPRLDQRSEHPPEILEHVCIADADHVRTAEKRPHSQKMPSAAQRRSCRREPADCDAFVRFPRRQRSGVIAGDDGHCVPAIHQRSR